MNSTQDPKQDFHIKEKKKRKERMDNKYLLNRHQHMLEYILVNLRR